MNLVMKGAAVGSLLGASSALAATQVQGPPGSEWVTFAVQLLVSFGPLAVGVFLQWRRNAVARKERAAAAKLLDKDKSNDEQARKDLEDARLEKKALDVAEEVVEQAEKLKKK